MLILSRTRGVMATRIHQYGVALHKTSGCRLSSNVMGCFSTARALHANAPPARPLHATCHIQQARLQPDVAIMWLCFQV